MKDTSVGHMHDSGWYQIRVMGQPSSRWVTRLDGLTLTIRDDRSNVLEGPVVDQAAPQGPAAHAARPWPAPGRVTRVDTDTAPVRLDAPVGTITEGD